MLGGWSIDWLVGWFVDWLSERLVDRSADWSVGWSLGWSVRWFVDESLGGLAVRLSIGLPEVQSACCSPAPIAGRMVISLVGWSAGHWLGFLIAWVATVSVKAATFSLV